MPRASRKDVEAARTLVRQRDGEQCQLCGMPASEQHHRRRKGMGGSAALELASVLITACGRGNTSGCHGLVHQHPHVGHGLEWLLYERQDPASTPVYTIHGWVYLSDDGGRTPCESPLLGEVAG